MPMPPQPDQKGQVRTKITCGCYRLVSPEGDYCGKNQCTLQSLPLQAFKLPLNQTPSNMAQSLTRVEYAFSSPFPLQPYIQYWVIYFLPNYNKSTASTTTSTMYPLHSCQDGNLNYSDQGKSQFLCSLVSRWQVST